MKKLLLAIILFLVMPARAEASGGITKPPPPQAELITATTAQTITLPYEFDEIDFSGAETEELDIDLTNIEFINLVGSIGLTTVSILTGLVIIGIFVVLLLAIRVVFWIWSLVTETPHTTTLRLFDAAEVGANLYDTHLMLQEGDVDRQAQLYRNPGYWTGERALIQGRRRDVATFKSITRGVKSGFKRLGSGR